MTATFKLTEIQKQAAAQLYRLNHLVGVNMNTVKALIAKGVIEKTNGKAAINMYELAFTFEAEDWADVMFGSSDPDPDDSEPMTAQDAMLATEPVLARDWLSDEDNEAFAELNIEPLPVVAENATAKTAAPEIGVQWLRREDLIKTPYANPRNSLYWYGEDEYLYRYRLNAPQPAKLPPNFNFDGSKVLHAVRPSNMAKGGNKAFTPQSQTPKRIARKRKQVLREIRREQASKVIPFVQPEVLENAA